MIKKIYKVSGMDCATCASLIELDLEDAGISAKCSYPKETLEVTFDETRTTEEIIKNIVNSAGYQLL